MKPATGEEWRLISQWPFAWEWGLLVGLVLLGLIALVCWRSGASRRSMKIRQRLVLVVFRVVLAVLLFVMIGGWQIVRFETDLPDLVVLVDSSRSMNLISDESSSGKGSQWDAVVDFLVGDKGSLWNRLSKSYRLQVYRIGSELQALEGTFESLKDSISKLTPEDDASRLGDHWLRAVENQRGRSTAAVVMLTDGALTSGQSWEEAGSLVQAEGLPLFMLQTGATDRPPQLAVVETIVDSTAMVGDLVTVLARVRWEGIRSASGNGRLEITLRNARSDEVVFRRELPVGANGMQGDSGSELLAISFTVTEPGKQEYQVEVAPYPGEVILDDNRSPVNFEVRDSAFRVLLVQGGPSYEFRFLKHLLERARTQDGRRPLVDLISVLQQGDALYAEQDRTARRLPPVDPETLKQLDLIILSDCDPNGLGNVFMNRIRELVAEQGVSLVIVAGSNHLPFRLQGTPLESLLPLTLDGMRATEVANRAWSTRLTELGEATPALRIAEEGSAWGEVGEFYWRVQGGGLRPGAQVLLTTADGQEPIIVSQRVGNGQVWLQLTDEMFRLHRVDSTGTLYERYWLQMIRGLSRPVGLTEEEHARLIVPGERYGVGQSVPFSVRLSRQLATNAGGFVEVEVNDSQGTKRRFVANSEADGTVYRGEMDGLGMGDLRPGAYRVELTRPLGAGGPVLDSFVIAEDSTEMSNFFVDLETIQRVAEQTGGTLLRIDEAKHQLERVLPQGRAMRTRPLQPIVLWNHWFVATLLFAILSSEWILRRRWGSI